MRGPNFGFTYELRCELVATSRMLAEDSKPRDQEKTRPQTGGLLFLEIAIANRLSCHPSANSHRAMQRGPGGTRRPLHTQWAGYRGAAPRLGDPNLLTGGGQRACCLPWARPGSITQGCRSDSPEGVTEGAGSCRSARGPWRLALLHSRGAWLR